MSKQETKIKNMRSLEERLAKYVKYGVTYGIIALLLFMAGNILLSDYYPHATITYSIQELIFVLFIFVSYNSLIFFFGTLFDSYITLKLIRRNNYEIPLRKINESPKERN